ncbi:MAG TPA: patatin-like phospholipase family protein [Xanthobacteraceae bacterium]|nr:patatin-like phospholipase family protein [Xanthobacteraceae bacterium]
MGIRARSRREVSPRAAPRTLALALGGGGARGLAHVVVMEALDDVGVRPVAIAGSSIGAAIGAAYAAGLSGKAIRRHVISLAHERGETIARLFGARAVTLSSMIAAPFGNPMLLDAHKLCAAFLPPAVPDDFAQLEIPLIVPATDLYGRSEVAFATGPLKIAIAASMAVPGLLRPVEHDGRVLVDGAAINPLPYEHLRERADVILAVDTTVGPIAPRGIPDPWDNLFATLQVMSHTIVLEKLKRGAPDILIRPELSAFRLLDFFHASAILRAAEPVKAQVKERLAKLL